MALSSNVLSIFFDLVNCLPALSRDVRFFNTKIGIFKNRFLGRAAL